MSRIPFLPLAICAHVASSVSMPLGMSALSFPAADFAP